MGPENAVGAVVGRVRQDAYTGENRCWPCTVLNLGLLGIAGAIVSVTVSAEASVAVLLVGVAAIWLRGYLVPYTPSLTGRILPLLPGTASPRRERPDAPERESGVDDGDVAAPEIVGDLLNSGVLTESDGELSLTPSFRDAWRSDIERDRLDDSDTLADDLEDIIDWVADASIVTEDDRQWIRLVDEDESIQNETWLAPSAAAADLTAVRTLEAQTDLPGDLQTLAAPSLRQFLEDCPICGTALEVRSPHACCGSPRYMAEGIEAVLSCPACDEIVTVFEGDEDAG